MMCFDSLTCCEGGSAWRSVPCVHKWLSAGGRCTKECGETSRERVAEERNEPKVSGT
jgi:hypothetical protein